MRKALYFGSFNPIHYGHVAIAEFLANEGSINEVILVVSPKNPIKDASELENPHTRFERVKSEIEKVLRQRNDNFIAKITVSDIEFHLPKPLYTINTLREIQNLHPKNEYILVVGEDNIGILEKWYKWEELLKEFELWVYPRPGYDFKKKCAAYAALPWVKSIRFLNEAPVNDISSTELRNNRKK